jgi:hypothetical protein
MKSARAAVAYMCATFVAMTACGRSESAAHESRSTTGGCSAIRNARVHMVSEISRQISDRFGARTLLRSPTIGTLQQGEFQGQSWGSLNR